MTNTNITFHTHKLIKKKYHQTATVHFLKCVTVWLTAQKTCWNNS